MKERILVMDALDTLGASNIHTLALFTGQEEKVLLAILTHKIKKGL